MKGLYRSLARTGIQNNRETAAPFTLATMGMIALFFILVALKTRSEWDTIYGMDKVQDLLTICIGAVGLFSVVFVFYVGNHMMKSRAGEFALYNVLGLEKKHLRKVLFWERLWLGGISLGGGLLLGALLFKLAEEGLFRIVGTSAEVGFLPPLPAFFATTVFFGSVLFLLFLDGVRRIHTTSPIRQLRESKIAERAPKVRWLFAFLSLLTLGGGYALALSSENPLDALKQFTFGVLLVAVGTYFGFIALTVMILKLLQRRRGYYYRTRNFTAVSGLLYRMKANAVGLASICLLSTAVIVLLSMAVSLLAGQEEALRARFPRGVVVEAETLDEQRIQAYRETVDALLAERDLTEEAGGEIAYASVSAWVQDGTIRTEFHSDQSGLPAPKRYQVRFVAQQEINPYLKHPVSLAEGEAAVFLTDVFADKEKLTFKDNVYTLRANEAPLAFQEGSPIMDMLKVYAGGDPIFIVLADREEVHRLHAQYSQDQSELGEAALEAVYWRAFDVSADRETEMAFGAELRTRLAEEEGVHMEVREAERQLVAAVYGGIFFSGAFLGIVFLLATAMIIYYKQLTEGYADRSRFAVLRKVGMTKAEVRDSIRTQVRVVFFLPLMVAAVHMAFAFPVLNQLLRLFNLANTRLFLVSVVGVYLCFALFYFATYAWTSRVYYRVVTQ